MPGQVTLSVHDPNDDTEINTNDDAKGCRPKKDGMSAPLVSHALPRWALALLVVLSLAVLILLGLIIEQTSTSRIRYESIVAADSDADVRLDALAAEVTRQGGHIIHHSATSPDGYSLLQSLDVGSGEWAPGVHMPEARSDSQAVLCGDRVYLLGGLDSAGNVSADVLAFDYTQEVYDSAVPPMPSPRYRFAAACLDGRVHVSGGFTNKADGDNGVPTATTDVLDTQSRVWATGQPLLEARGDAAMAAGGGKLHIMGGYGAGFSTLDSMEVFTPADGTWKEGATMPEAKGDISAVEIAGLIYVPGGWGGDDYVFLRSLSVYSVAEEKWEAAPEMKVARGDKAVGAVNGKLYVMGGEVWSGYEEMCPWDETQICPINLTPVHVVEQYDPSAKVWTSVAPMPFARFRFPAASVCVGGSCFIHTFGGHGHGEVAVNEMHSFYFQSRNQLFVHQKDPQ